MTRLLVLVLVLNFYQNIDCQNFRFDYKYNAEAEGWFKLHRIPAIWHEAQLRCRLEGTVLASPISSKMYSAMNNYLRSQNVDACGVFTGIHATFSKGDFFSIEGVPLNRMQIPWMDNEPDNADNQEDCIVLVNGTIADVNCSQVFPYVCYRSRNKATIVNSCGTVDNEYVLDSRTGSCYKFHNHARTWSRAFMTCVAEGAYLAIPNSHQEAKLLHELFEKHPGNTISRVNRGVMRGIMHIGFHDWNERGDWLTVDGKTLDESGYSSWSGGQPDNAPPGEYCGAMYRNGHLDDIWCDEPGPFVCEKKPDSLSELKFF